MLGWLATLGSARGARPEPGRLSALLMQHGSMSLRFYAPSAIDPQIPHDQDEIYIVVSGRGSFLSGPDENSLERCDFTAGDAIFAAAGQVHRFVDFSDDFGTWVVFYGPRGGEQG